MFDYTAMLKSVGDTLKRITPVQEQGIRNFMERDPKVYQILDQWASDYVRTGMMNDVRLVDAMIDRLEYNLDKANGDLVEQEGA